MAAIQQTQSWKADVATHPWKCPTDGKLYELDADRMRKEEYSFSGVRLPCTHLEPTDILLYNSGWEDDGESYISCNRKYLLGE